MFQISGYVVSKSGRNLEMAKDGRLKPARNSACHIVQMLGTDDGLKHNAYLGHMTCEQVNKETIQKFEKCMYN